MLVPIIESWFFVVKTCTESLDTDPRVRETQKSRHIRVSEKKKLNEKKNENNNKFDIKYIIINSVMAPHYDRNNPRAHVQMRQDSLFVYSGSLMNYAKRTQVLNNILNAPKYLDKLLIHKI